MIKSKKDILQKNSYKYHFNRSLYYHMQNKKVFSAEVIEDNSENWLAERIKEPNNDNSWQFYFNNPITKEICRDIIHELKFM